MDLYDWLLFLHVLSAFSGGGALVALWAIVFATRGPKPALAPEHATRIGNIAGPIVGASLGVTLIFGVWLTFEVDGYSLTDGWILGALLLWVVGAVTGGMAGKTFARNDASMRSKAVLLQSVSTLAYITILVLMIWKPGV